MEFEPDRKTLDAFMGLAFFLEEILGHKVELMALELQRNQKERNEH